MKTVVAALLFALAAAVSFAAIGNLTPPATTHGAHGAAHDKQHAEVVHRRFSRQELQRVERDPRSVVGTARMLPAFADGGSSGEPIGVKMLAVKPGSLWDRMGIVDGDVLTAVNGIPLNGRGAPFGDATKRDAMKIHVTRGERAVVLDIAFFDEGVDAGVLEVVVPQ